MYHPYLVSLLFAILLSLHLITFFDQLVYTYRADLLGTVGTHSCTYLKQSILCMWRRLSEYM